MTSDQTTLDYEARAAIAADVRAQLVADLDSGLDTLHTYDSHPSEDLRRDLLAMTWQLAQESSDESVRQALVNYMLYTYLHGTPFLQGQAIKFLQDFRVEDFDERAQRALERVSLSGQYGNEIIRLIGIADVRSRTDELKQIAAANWDSIPNVNLYASPTWAAALALARFGDSASTDRVIAKVKAEPNLITRASQLFAELGYTRQPAAFDALRAYLTSMERTERIKDNVPGTPEALYAARQFALHVEGCPVSGKVEEDDLPAIRSWADNQTSWTIRE